MPIGLLYPLLLCNIKTIFSTGKHTWAFWYSHIMLYFNRVLRTSRFWRDGARYGRGIDE